MLETLFESNTYTLSKVNEFKLCIIHKPTSKTVDFEGFAAQGIINTITQQSTIGHDTDETLDRIGNSILAKKGFK